MGKHLLTTGLLLASLANFSIAQPVTQESDTKKSAAIESSSASDRIQAIEIGAENSWPPYTDAQGKGISTTLIQAAFALTNIQPHFHVLPYSRVLHDLSAGKIDAGYNVTLQSTTEKRFVFGQVPLLQAESYWYFLPHAHSSIHSIEDVPTDFKVGVILDYEYGEAFEKFKQNFKIIRVSQQSQMIRMLKQGRLDAAIMFNLEADYTLKKLELPKDTLERRFLNHSGDIYLAFSPKNPHSKWLAQEFDNALLKLKATGDYEKIIHPIASRTVPIENSSHISSAH